MDREIARLEHKLHNLKLYTQYDTLFEQLKPHNLILLSENYPPGTDVSNLTGLDAQIAYDFQQLGYKLKIRSSKYHTSGSSYCESDPEDGEELDLIPIRPMMVPGTDCKYISQSDSDWSHPLFEATGWMLEIDRD